MEIFEEVRAEYAGFLASVLWKLTGDKELFAEALQYALLEMWRKVEKLDGEKAGAYIYRIALTANSKAWRNRIGRDGMPLRLTTQVVAAGQINSTRIRIEKDPQDRVSSSELAGLIRRAIAQLGAKQAGAIVMRYLQQQSYEVIAGKLNCSEDTARSHVSKALAALRDKLTALIEQE